MNVRPKLRLVAIVITLTIAAAACGSSGDSGGSSSDTEAGSVEDTNAAFVAQGGWNDGPCDASLPEVKLGQTLPISTAGLNFGEAADATEAAAAAFNARGGVNGRCIDVTVCDGKGAAPDELACARDQANDPEIVAVIDSQTPNAGADIDGLYNDAGMPRIGNAPPAGKDSPLAYDMAGGFVLYAYLAPFESVTVSKVAQIFPEAAAVAAVPTLIKPAFTALGIEQGPLIQVPPTAVDYTQFVLAAQNSGSDGAMLVSTQDQVLQIIDAMATLNSDLKVSLNWSTFDKEAMEDLPPDIVENMAFYGDYPHPASDPTQFPALPIAVQDLAASGNADLQPDTLNGIEGWVHMYGFVKVLRDAGVADITRQSIASAMDAAKDVDMLGLQPAWTPSTSLDDPIFKGISNSYVWTGSWDADADRFMVNPDQTDVLAIMNEGRASS